MNTGRISILAISLLTLSGMTAQAQAPLRHSVNAAQFLGPNFMQSPYHRVHPLALSDGSLLSYVIETPYERVVVTGTEQAKRRIHEIHATAILRQRSTGGAILGSAKHRTTNLVKTPFRIGKTLVNRAGDISNVEDAVLFIPEQVGSAAGSLLHGVGELGVTAARITKGAGRTKCYGFDCVEKAGEGIWSGFNSLTGKHKASRRLHAEFGTDPQTDNKAYRKEINRLAYANSYTGTALKIGVGQAGVDYLSPAVRGVGYVNNAEFVGGYQDANRQKKFEKSTYRAWGANPRAVDDIFNNKAFTKLTRRRLFNALNVIPDKRFSVRLLHDIANSPNRSYTQSQLALYDYIASLTMRGHIGAYINTAPKPLIALKDGTVILPLYSDYLANSPQLTMTLQSLATQNRQSALHILGHASPEVKQTAQRMGVQVIEWPGRRI